MGSCSALHLKLMQLHFSGKYCDVKIRVQGKSFPCHRVVLAYASEYFDALIGGSFMEKDANETVLPDIDVKTFKEVLRCVYTAKMCVITASNVLNLLSASLFLRIQSLEEACAQYILKNVSSMQGHIRILVLARSLNLTALIDVVTEHVIQNFKSFYNDETLLEITFDDLSFLLDRWSKSELPFKCEDLLLHFLIRWVYYTPVERRECSLELIAAVDFERISPQYVTFMMRYFEDIHEVGLERMPQLNLPEESKSTLDSPVGNWHNNTEDSKKRLCLKRKLSEHVAGKRTLSVNCSEEIPASFHDPTFYKDVSGLHIYMWNTLALIARRMNADDHNSADIRQTFCMYSSIDLKLATSVLTSPPVPLRNEYFNMCVTSQNDIYLFNFGIDGYTNYEPFANNLFSTEEIKRGFYRYNCEVDKWFPEPRRKFPPACSSICADHNLILYAISCDNYYCPSDYFHAFDYRSGKWMKLPKCIHSYHDNESSSCVL